MLELVAGLVLAAAAVLFVLRPVFRPELADAAERGGDATEGDDPDDDLSPQAVALRALKEIEFDRATGKLSDADYEELKGRYTAEALAALRGAEAPPAWGAPPPASQLALGVARPARTPRAPTACPTHGPRPETDSQFCSECGRRLASAPGFCARCGTSLERDAHYCHACGARVAA